MTDAGAAVAEALLRRHRLWERFLTDMLELPWDEAHEIAERLEHAAPEKVTERLAQLLGEPVSCPHGVPIPPHATPLPGVRLNTLATGAHCCISRISPELPDVLRQLHEVHLSPGSELRVLARGAAGVQVEVAGRQLTLSPDAAATVWVLEKDAVENRKSEILHPQEGAQ